MIKGNTRKVVVIKDIPSNYIEEAILVLKSEPTPGTYSKPLGSLNNSKKNDCLMKEAEYIINNYIRESAIGRNPDGPLGDLPDMPRKKFFTNVMINLVLVGSIALVIFLVTKLMQ